MEKFKDVAHLYLGCKMQCVKGNSDYQYEGKKVELTPLFLSQPKDNLDTNFWKPILRPLSSMTDEEAYEIGVNHNWYVSGASEKYMRNRAYSIRERIIVGTGFTPTLMLHLLNLRFDLFGLIESGEAIESTTV